MTLPKVKFWGGPHGRRMTYEVDGQRLTGVRRIEIVSDVNDVNRVTIHQLAEVNVECEGLVERVWHARVHEYHKLDADDIPTFVLVADCAGTSLVDAIRKAADAIEEGDTE